MNQIETKCNIIFPERYFLIIDNKNNRQFVTMDMKNIRINEKNINLSFFNNKKLNTFWDITDPKNYIEITEKEFKTQDTFKDEELEYSKEKLYETSNTHICQSEKSQKLSNEEIAQLQKNTLNEDKLKKTIVSNSKSIEKRNLFSKEKIIKKITQKNKSLIRLVPTNLANIIETIFLSDIKSINFLGIDSISTMLTNSNFLPNTNTIIYEEASNILSQAYVLKTQFSSRIYHLFKGKISLTNLNLFNILLMQKEVVTYINYDNLIDEKKFCNKMIRNKFKFFFDNLVICVKNDNEIPIIFKELFGFLKYSGNLVIFAKDMGVLANLNRYLCENKLGVNTRIIETITREFQTLQLRTAPMVNEKGYSGYVLTSFKAVREEGKI